MFLYDPLKCGYNKVGHVHWRAKNSSHFLDVIEDLSASPWVGWNRDRRVSYWPLAGNQHSFASNVQTNCLDQVKYQQGGYRKKLYSFIGPVSHNIWWENG